MLTMEEAFAKSQTSFSADQIIEGTVIEVRSKEVVVDIGYKSEGTVPLNEFGEDNKPDIGSRSRCSLRCLRIAKARWSCLTNARSSKRTGTRSIRFAKRAK